MSFADEDRPFAQRVVGRLRQHGLDVWFAPSHLRGADQWHDEIGRALDRCDWFILVLSPAAIRSRWVKRELLFALDEARYDDRITPILLRRCKPKRLSWTLGAVEQISFCDRRFGDAFEDLLATWGL